MTAGTDRPKLSPAEKLQARIERWMSPPGVEFISPEVKLAYRERVQLFMDTVQLKKTERIPISPNLGFYPIAHAGFTAREAMYDYDKVGAAMEKFHADFATDSLTPSMTYGPGPMFDILDYRLYRWPGHGVDPTMPFQCVESEYMTADEYDQLIDDPSNYFMRRYFPRIFGSLDGCQGLGAATDNLNIGRHPGYFVQFAQPRVREAILKLLEAGQAAQEWRERCTAIDRRIMGSFGRPIAMGVGVCNAPFDTIGDTLRGTRGIMMDMFRRPQKLLAAVERFVPLGIDMGVRASQAIGFPFTFIPLHKGSEGFMSVKDFERFYWPTLRALILGLIEEGVVPQVFVEGTYDLPRLDIIADSGIPKGKTMWLFDKTDMVEVKKRFAPWACFAGNVPVSMMKAGSPADVRNYVKGLIDEVACDGGFILSTGAVIDDAKPENLHALIDTGREYGKV